MFTIPSAVGLLLIGKPLIALLFQGGEFNAQSTELVYFALQFYTVALISQSMLDIVVRAFAAQKDTWTPLYVSFFTTAINIGLAIWLTRPLSQGGIEHGGPALANGLAVGIEAITGLVILHIRWQGVDARRIITDALKAVAAAVAMALVLLAIRSALEGSVVLTVAVGSIVGVAVYLGVAFLLGIREVYSIPLAMVSRLARRQVVAAASDD
jgi:putative peptidoglycan lipid II flippase